MTQRTTEKMLKLQLENAIINTGLKLFIGSDSGTSYLGIEGSELSKRGTKTEIYNILYTLNNVLSFGKTQWQKNGIMNILEYHKFNTDLGNCDNLGHVELKGLTSIMIRRKDQQ